jgi:hypothetical protein
MIIMIVIVGIGIDEQNDKKLNPIYGHYVYLDENDNTNINNNNNYRVKSYESFDDVIIYERFLDIINKNNKKYDKFNSVDKYKENILYYEEINKTKSKPIPIPKSNY